MRAIAVVLGFPDLAPAAVAVSVVLVIAPDGREIAAAPADHALAAEAAGPAVVFAAKVAAPDDRVTAGVPVCRGPAAEASGHAVVFAAKVAAPDDREAAGVPVCHASAATAAVLLVVVVDTLFLFDTVFPASVAADEDDNS